jgi:quercetin dioxygenase-like cupin family protein
VKTGLGLAISTLVVISIGMLFAQSGPPSGATGAVVINSGEAKWQHDASDPAGTESAVLREDPGTGGLELLVRYPAGHVFPPHWHSANERIILLEGRMSIQVGGTKKSLEPGGFAYLPAKEIQELACVSNTRCAFYVYWDGKLDFHKVSGN